MQRRLFLLPALCLALAAGCSSRETTQPSNTPVAPAAAPAAVMGDFKVALLTTGPVTDKGWNESAYDGVLAIQKDLGATIEKQESLQPNQFEEAFRDFANRGFNIVIGHGDEFNAAANKVAKDYPKTVFVTTGGDHAAPNVVPIVFVAEEACYLQGMEAAMISKTGKGGFIGGQQLPNVQSAADAFGAGAKAVNPKFVFQQAYLGSWTDTGAAKAQTEALLTAGSDVISQNCDAAAKGVFDSAGAKPNTYTFGANSDQNSQAPNVFSSFILDVPKAFDDLAKQVKGGTYKGEILKIGLKDGDVRLLDNPKFASVLTADQKAKIAQATQDIEAGKLKVTK